MSRERYVYGLRIRPAGAWCQPDGEERVADYCKKGRYWSLVAYDHQLSEKECDHFSLDLIGVEVVDE